MIAYVHCLFTITKDQTTISISNKVSTVTESNIGTVNAGFTVSLSNASYLPVTVTYTTADDTATVLDNDYVAGTGLVTFAPDVTSQPVTEVVSGDTKFELTEQYFVNLSAPGNATI